MASFWGRGKSNGKHLVALVLLGLVVLGAEGLHAQPYARDDRQAFAEWVVPIKNSNRSRWYAIEVEIKQSVAGDAAPVTASVLRGTCEEDEDFTFCSGRGTRVEIDPEDFEMAPDLSSASVAFRHKRRGFEAHWSAADPIPGQYMSWEGCMDSEGETGEGQGGGIFRPAPTEGTFAGRSFDADPDGFSTLSRGAMVTECGPYIREVGLRDGSFRVTTRNPATTPYWTDAPLNAWILGGR